MHSSIASKRQEIAVLCHRYHVRRLELFGSATGERFDPGRSDMDFAVEFESLDRESLSNAYFGLLDELEALLGVQVDLVTSRSIRNPFFKKRLDQTKIPLYAR
ncbi:MAG: nucleotidyltransferase family protein [Chloroflexota bacterium]